MDRVTPAPAAGVAEVDCSREEILRGHDRVMIRPIRVEDTALERRFIETLSPEARRFRFLMSFRLPSDALVQKMTDIDPATAAAFVAVIMQGGQEREVGVARFAVDPGGDCEFAVAVSDDWQNKGLGKLLMSRLIDVARARGIHAMHSSDSASNELMRRFAKHLHYQHSADPDDATLVRTTVHLGHPDPLVDEASGAT